MSQAPARKRNSMAAQDPFARLCAPATLTAIGVVFAVMMCAPAPATAEKRREGDVADILGREIRELKGQRRQRPVHHGRQKTGKNVSPRSPQTGQGTVIKRKAPAHGQKKSTSRKDKKKQASRKPKSPTVVSWVRAKWPKDRDAVKAKLRTLFGDPVFAVACWRMLVIMEVQSLVRSLGEKWPTWLNWRKRAGQWAFNRFQQTKDKVALGGGRIQLLMLEMIQKLMELGERIFQQAGGTVTPLPTKRPPALRGMVPAPT